MTLQNSLGRMILNSRLVYIGDKTYKDMDTLNPDIDYEELGLEELEDDYEIVFYDKESGVLKLEKYNKDKKILYALGGLSPEKIKELKNKIKW